MVRKIDVVGNIVGQHGVDIREAERVGVAAHEIECPLVDIHGPDRRVRRLDRESQRDRAPAAAEVQQVPAGRRGGVFARSTAVPESTWSGLNTPPAVVTSTSDPASVHADAAKILGAGGGRAEVVVAPHGLSSVAEDVSSCGSLRVSKPGVCGGAPSGTARVSEPGFADASPAQPSGS